MHIDALAPLGHQLAFGIQRAAVDGSLQLGQGKRLQWRQPGVLQAELAAVVSMGEIKFAAAGDIATSQLAGHVEHGGRCRHGGQAAQCAVQVLQIERARLLAAGSKVGIIEATAAQGQHIDLHFSGWSGRFGRIAGG